MKITIDRSLLEQALEALKDNREDVSRGETSRYMLQHYDPVITALCEALAQPQHEPVALRWLVEMIMSDCGCSSNNQRLFERLTARISQYERANTSPPAQPQQEPVAVVDDAGVIVVCSYKYKPGDKLYTSPPERNRQSGRGQQMNDENKNLYAFPIGTADHEYHRKMIADAKVAMTSAAKHLRHGDTLGASLALQPVEKTLDALSVAPHPAQRKPLTDRELELKEGNELAHIHPQGWIAVRRYARAVEAKHEIKETR